MKTNICPTCFEEKELVSKNFEPRKDSKTGFRNQCRLCQKGMTVRPTNLKKCVTCGLVKQNTNEFFKEEIGVLNGRPRTKDGLTKKCLNCIEEYLINYRNNPENKNRRKIYIKDYNQKNKEKLKIDSKTWYEKNKDKVKKRGRLWRKNNPEKYYQTGVEYRQKNLKKHSEYKKNWMRKTRESSELHRVKDSLRARLRFFTKFKKSKPTSEIIGCTWEELIQHLESNFQPGMSWDNHGRFGWHIDHIIPLASAKSVEDLHQLNHFTNLKPLWWKDNLRKSTKIL